MPNDPRNPYSPPEAKVSDAGPLPPGSQPPVSERLYTGAQIGLAAFLGSFLAASWFYAQNLAATGRPEWKSRALLVGFIATLILAAVSFLLAEKTPNMIVPLAGVFIARTYADINFRKIIGTHLGAGGRQGSWWFVVGVSLLFLLAIIAVTAIVVLVFFRNEISATSSTLLEQPCSIYTAMWPSSPAEMAA